MALHHYCSDSNLSHVTLTYESHSSIYFLQIPALFHPNEASYWRSSDAIRCYKWRTLLLHYVRTKQFKGHGSYFYVLYYNSGVLLGPGNALVKQVVFPQTTFFIPTLGSSYT